MKEQINIAIFGLSLVIENNIKQKIQNIFKNTPKVNWVTLTDSDIDILLVNELFINSSTVQQLIVNRVPYLRLVTNELRAGQIDQDILYLPFQVNEQTQTWFYKRYLAVPLHQTQITPKEIKNNNLDLKQIIQEFFDESNGVIQVFDRYGELAIINTKTEQVWVHAKREIETLGEGMNYTYATIQMVQESSMDQGIDLRQWLWNLLWQSNLSFEKPTLDQTFQLVMWPHPYISTQRYEIFQLAACFEQGASLNEVQQKTKLSLKLVEKFIFVASLCHLAKIKEPLPLVQI